MTKHRPLPTVEILRELIDYDPLTGALRWRERGPHMFKTMRDCSAWNTRFADSFAFATNHGDGYLSGRIFDQRYYAHQIAWCLATGEDADQIDHVNGNKSDNRLSNLRVATGDLNHKNKAVPRNNTSGFVGVGWHPARKRWFASMTVGGKQPTKYFITLAEAVAHRRALEALHGFHANHGKRRAT